MNKMSGQKYFNEKQSFHVTSKHPTIDQVIPKEKVIALEWTNLFISTTKS